MSIITLVLTLITSIAMHTALSPFVIAVETEIFNELPVARDCFQPLLKISDPNHPECKFLVANQYNEGLTVDCIHKNVSSPALRVVGEFHIIKIICTANFPIDFRYYGIQPTEAMLIDWYKDVEPGRDRSTQKFIVEVKVYSVNALFNFYNNPNNSYYEDLEEFQPPQTIHDYSRSGSYEFHGIFNKSIGTSFYFILEDTAKPSFLRNPKTIPRKSRDNFILPCVSSHFDAEVELADIPSTITRHHETSPVDGIIFKLENDMHNYYGYYRCKLKYKGVVVDSIDFTFENGPPAPERNFGLENFDFNSGANLDVSGEPIFEGEYVKFIKPFCKTRSLSDPVNLTQLQLISVPIHNFAYMRLVQQFALPKYFNRSYTARLVNSISGGWDSLVRQIKQSTGTTLRTGTLYCSTGYSEKIIDFGSTIRGIVIPFDYSEDWATFDRESNNVKDHYGIEILNESRPLYAGKITAFACRINIPVVVKPVIWYTERENGSRVQEKIDYDLVGDTATWYANLTLDVRKVICAASYWYSDWWREIPQSLSLQQITKPVISKEGTSRTYHPGAEVVTLECLAWGNPKPTVYFEKDGLRFVSLDFENGTTMILKQPNSKNCGKYTCVATNGFETRQDFFINEEPSTFDVLVVVIPLVVFLITVCAAVVYIKFFRKEKTGLTEDEIKEFQQGMKREQIPKGDENYAHGFAAMRPYTNEYEVDSGRFIVYQDRVLGTGAFGIVTMGLVDHKLVAVKTVQKDAEKQYLKALLSELKILIYLGNHSNVVQIVGAYTKDLNKGLVYIFVEYVSLGNLQSYLRKNKTILKLPGTMEVNKFSGYVKSSEFIFHNKDYKKGTAFTLHNLFEWSKQIADGMEYLGSKKVIHGDLATRNVLLDEKLNIKITDFGLSRQLYDYRDYVKKQQEPLPWRWMALESLKYLTFSTRSDVWAFGITVWEIFTLGELPYPGYTWNMDFVYELERGLRLNKPRFGSDQLFSIIRQCWNEDPSGRPSFTLLKQQLNSILPENPPALCTSAIQEDNINDQSRSIYTEYKTGL